jgi:hypothetical protein
MSHTTKIEGIAVKSETAINTAVEELKSQGINCALSENAKPRAYYRDQIAECDLVLGLQDGPYDVGFRYDQEKGEYSLEYDNWQNGISRILGNSVSGGGTANEVGKFLQEYSKAAIIEQATAMGHIVEGCDMNEHGEYELVLQTL